MKLKIVMYNYTEHLCNIIHIHRHAAIIILFFFIFTFTQCVKKVDVTFTITGEVVTNGIPLNDVDVVLASDRLISFKTKTNEEGVFNFPGLLEGTYVVEPRLEGYVFSPSKRSVPITKSGMVHLAFNGTLVWSHHYGGYYDEEAFSVKQTSDGGYIVAGRTNSGGTGWTDVYMAKLDAFGNIDQGPFIFGGDEDDVAYAVEQTSDGGYVVAGSTMADSRDFLFVKKFDGLFNFEWERTYGEDERNIEIRSLQETSAGHYIVAGFSASYIDNISDALAIKIDPNKAGIEASDIFRYSAGIYDYIYDIKETSDQGYILTGSTTSIDDVSGDYNTKILLIKIDSSLNPEWPKAREYDFSRMDEAFSVQEISGGYILAGYSGVDPLVCNMRIIQVDSSGEVVWSRLYPMSITDRAHSIVPTMDGGYAVGGIIWSDTTCSLDYCLLKIDTFGEVEWRTTYNGSGFGDDIAYSVIHTVDGGYALGGYSETAYNGKDIFILKVDPNGNIR